MTAPVRVDDPSAPAARPPARISRDGNPAAGLPGESDPPRGSWAPREVDQVAELRRLTAELEGRLCGAPIPAAERAEALGEVCRRWRDPANRFRRAIVRSLVEEAGRAPATAAAGLDASLRAWSPGAWRALAARLPAAGAAGSEPWVGVVPHVLGSALPAPHVLPIFFTLLAGGAALARVGRHAPSLPAIAVAALADVDPRLALRAAVGRWPRDRADLTRALFAGARVGTATGGDAAAAAITSLVGPGTRLLAHPHRVSFAYVGASALGARAGTSSVAARLALDVALHDQEGCLSPVGALVEGGRRAVLRFADQLAAGLADRQAVWPRAALGPAAALSVRAFHDAFAVVAAERRGARVLAGDGLAWVVGVLAEGGGPPPWASFGRSLWVAAVTGAAEGRRTVGRWRGATASLGVVGNASERRRARWLADWLGAWRRAPVGRMQSPPLAWRQDGARPVLDLLPRPALEPWA